QRQIHGDPGALVGVHIGGRVDSHTDTQSHGQFITDVDHPYLIQQRKLRFHDLLKVLLLKNEEELILLELLDNGVQSLHVPYDLSLYQRKEKRLPHFFHVHENFFIVVNVNETGDHSLALGLFPVFHQLSLVKEIEGEKH